MLETTDQPKQIRVLWEEAREVSLVLQENWASLIRSKRLFLESAAIAGIDSSVAERHHAELVAAAHREYSEAFKRMCELSDEYTTAKLKIESTMLKSM